MTTTVTTDTTPTDTTPQIFSIETTAQHVAGTATQVSIRARQHTFTIDEPADLGGADLGANPVEHLLAALGSCQVITYQVWAQKLGITLDTIDIALSGDIDLRGFLGLDDTVRPGFGAIHLAVAITGPDADERYVELIETVGRHCPVEDNLAHGVPVHGTVTVNATPVVG